MAKILMSGEAVVNISGGYPFFQSIEADHVDGGVWVGFSGGLAKLNSNGNEEWQWVEQDMTVTGIALEPEFNVFDKIYVNAATGSDVNGDGSMLSPFQSINQGIRSADKGDTVIVAAGRTRRI
ncbi:MAG: hypothetical protein M0036_15470 [Desulfobacteraceae bacterium]|nr:hypothetical protein [Desulfobacteraceae bacterium]